MTAQQADALAAFLSNWKALSALSTPMPETDTVTSDHPQPQRRSSMPMPTPSAAPALPSSRTLRRRNSNYDYDTTPSSNDGTTESLAVTDSLRASSHSSEEQHHHRNDPLHNEGRSRQLSSPSSVYYEEVSGILSLNDISSLPRPPFDVGARSFNGEQTPQQPSSTSSRSSLTSPPHSLGVGHPQVQRDGETLAARASPAGALGERPDSEAMKEG